MHKNFEKPIQNKTYTEKEIKHILQKEITLPDIVTKRMDEAFTKIHEEGSTIMRKEKTKKNYTKKGKFLKQVAAAVIIILLCGSVTVVAATLMKWNPQMAEEFQVNEEEQNRLVKEGVAKVLDAYTSCNGVTIRADTALFDSDYMYLYFAVETPDNIELTDNDFFDEFTLSIEGEPIHASYFSGITQADRNIAYYSVWIMNRGDMDLKGKELMIHFADLYEGTKTAEEGKLLVDGKWDMTIPIEYTDKAKTYQIDKEIEGTEGKVKSITISPISIKVFYDWPRIEQKDDSYEEPLSPTAYRLKDGTAIPLDLSGTGSAGYPTENTTEYIISFGCNKVYQVEDIKGVIFGENQFEVEVAR